MSTLILSGWKLGFDKIALTKIIRKHTGYGLAQGKRCTDDVLGEKPVMFSNLFRPAAEEFLHDVQQVGVMGTILEEE